MDLFGEYFDFVYRICKGLFGMKREINVVKLEEIDNLFECYINLLFDLYLGFWNWWFGIIVY